MTFWKNRPVFPKTPPTCPVCDKIVTYHSAPKGNAQKNRAAGVFTKQGSHRKFCHKCGRWAHGYNSCFSRVEDRCLSCAGNSVKVFRECAQSLELSPGDEEDSCVLILASMGLGSDEKVLAQHTGFDPEWIKVRAERLRANGVWLDGKVYLDREWEDGPEEANICMILMVMCAEGEVLRVPKDVAPTGWGVTKQEKEVPGEPGKTEV